MNVEFYKEGFVEDKEIEKLRASVGWDNTIPPHSEIKEHLFTYFTARINGELIGYINVLSDGYVDAYLQDLMVHPEYQNEGIGSELLKRAIKYLQRNKIKAIQVIFGPELEGFYKKFGFHIVKAGIIDRDTMKIEL
jgi:ribosomal protein S18 acetylase RimI-like enzyme